MNSLSIENKLISLIYSCPLDIRCDNCAIIPYRKFLNNNLIDVISVFDKNKINDLLLRHNSCMKKRIKNEYPELNSNNYYNKNGKCPYVQWTNKTHIDKLSHELKSLNWIKSQSEFVKFFDIDIENSIVRWNMKYKYELAYLIYKLKEGYFIRTINSKGYFCIVENYFVGFSGEKFKNNTLKKLNSKITTESNKYIVVIEKIDNLISNI